MRATVPGQVQWDDARTDFANGNIGGGLLHSGLMLGEQILTAVTYVEGQSLKLVTKVLDSTVSLGSSEANQTVNTIGKALSKSEEKAINSYNKRIDEHLLKLEEFKTNPSVKPGMENMPKEAIEKQWARRIDHLEKEIRTFRSNIQKILNDDGK